ncbi:hypothetical protein [Glutamicibacter sp. JC586]|uniref:hypothetical protein n=1 Tax=Glutamicibacter sp. JC586 TaxID=2590552 RepID=UPI001357081F|nr:hypothetical protein [Glutamicibacter sp. JC586]
MTKFNAQNEQCNSQKRKIAWVLGSTVAVATVSVGLILGNNYYSAQAGPTTQKLQDNLADVAKSDAQTGEEVKVDTQAQVIKSLGQPGKLTVDGTTKPSFEITVHSVKVLNSCTLRGFGEKISPENKKFLLLDVSAKLAESAEKVVKEDIALMPLDASAFGVSPGRNRGVVYDLNTVAAFSCDVDKALDIAVGAGDEIRGNVILDSPYANGQVVYDPDKTGGWTWSY